MEIALPSASVDGYHARLSDFDQLPDPDDRHVIAAAVEAEAAFLMTFNSADFPSDIHAPHGVVAIHPDHLLTSLQAALPDAFETTLASVRLRLLNPPLSRHEHLAVLANVGVPALAISVAKWLDED